uniref:Shugoshin C-terminal domain-containing protein n=1 Tax=Setaria digitata TaxID=48799 RepID=A0A915PMI7_9BILA
MSSTSISQLMADMRQLVINLQTRERATDSALAKSQIVSDKISGMKEYQEEVANMNDCWRMQGRKVLVAGLQHENRQILQLQQENRELRQALEDCESTLQLVMQKHRDVVTKFTKQFVLPIRTSPAQSSKKCETSVTEKIVNLSRLLDECLADGESVSNHDQELIARLTTENACLRELLNISTCNDPNITRQFLDRTDSVGGGQPKCSNGPIAVKKFEQSFGGDSLPSFHSPTTPSLHRRTFYSCTTLFDNRGDIRRNSFLVLMKKVPDTVIKKSAKSHAQKRKQCVKNEFH